MSKGKLVVVGSGIKGLSHMTLEAKSWIEKADKVFFLLSEPVTQAWILKTNPNSVNLQNLYAGNKPRLETYQEMTDTILEAVRSGQLVCAVFYGHPGVFALPTHKALREARDEGFEATMLPGISAEDCLFADLGVDPSTHGYQSYEATWITALKPALQTFTHVVIWQIGVIYESGFDPAAQYKNSRIDLFVEYLKKYYAKDKECYVYYASSYPHIKSYVWETTVEGLVDCEFPSGATLYIPPDSYPKKDIAVESKVKMNEANFEKRNVPCGRPESRLAEVLALLAVDTNMLLEFNRDPVAFIDNHAPFLNEKERKALVEQDYEITYDCICREDQPQQEVQNGH